MYVSISAMIVCSCVSACLCVSLCLCVYIYILNVCQYILCVYMDVWVCVYMACVCVYCVCVCILYVCVSLCVCVAVRLLTRLLSCGQDVLGDGDPVVRAAGPLHHAPPTLHGERDVCIAHHWTLVDAQHCRGGGGDTLTFILSLLGRQNCQLATSHMTTTILDPTY